MKLDHEYYTLEGAADLLDKYSLNDIHHFIEIGKISPALFSPKRRYIALTWDQENNQWIAHATCSYRGLLEVNQNLIECLLDKGKIILSTPSKPITPENINHWDARHPYENKEPRLGFSAWHSYVFLDEDVPRESLRLIPFASEIKSILSTLKTAVDFSGSSNPAISTFFEKYKVVEVDGKEELAEKHRYTYDFNENGAFKKDSLRLTEEHISTLTNKPDTSFLLACMPRKTKAKKPDEESLPWSNSKNGGDLVNKIIEQMYRLYPKEPSAQIWQKMENFYDEEQSDSVIERVTTDEISWTSRNGDEKFTSYKAFINKISQIRGFYRGNGIQIPK